MIGIIYLLTSPSGKQYVGQTIQELHKRVNGHVNSSNREDATINKAIRKYGIGSFKKEIIITIQTDEVNIFNQLNKLEELFIKIYNTYKRGYNSTTGGGSRKPTDEVRKKQSISHIGNKASEETKLKMSIKSKGRKHTEEAKEKLRQINLGKKHTKETLIKLSISKLKAFEKSRLLHNGYALSEQTRNRMSISSKLNKVNCKPVIQYLNETIVKEWDSATQASKELCISQGNINSCCRGERNKAGSYKWKFK